MAAEKAPQELVKRRAAGLREEAAIAGATTLILIAVLVAHRRLLVQLDRDVDDRRQHMLSHRGQARQRDRAGALLLLAQIAAAARGSGAGRGKGGGKQRCGADGTRQPGVDPAYCHLG